MYKYPECDTLWPPPLKNPGYAQEAVCLLCCPFYYQAIKQFGKSGSPKEDIIFILISYQKK